MAVSIWPGATAFAVIRWGPSSIASVLTSATTPALLAQYAEPPGSPCSPAMEAVASSRPPPSPLDHRACGRLEGEHHADQVHAQDALPAGGRPVEEVLHERHPGVGDADVELPVARGHANGIGHLSRVGDVGDQRLAGVLWRDGVREDDGRAVGRQAAGGRGADAGGRAGDERAAAGQGKSFGHAPTIAPPSGALKGSFCQRRRGILARCPKRPTPTEP